MQLGPAVWFKKLENVINSEVQSNINEYKISFPILTFNKRYCSKLASQQKTLKFVFSGWKFAITTMKSFALLQANSLPLSFQ